MILYAIRLLDEDVIEGDETTDVLITESGLKDPDVVTKTFRKASTIKPDLEGAEKLMKKR